MTVLLIPLNHLLGKANHFTDKWRHLLLLRYNDTLKSGLSMPDNTIYQVQLLKGKQRMVFYIQASVVSPYCVLAEALGQKV